MRVTGATSKEQGTGWEPPGWPWESEAGWEPPSGRVKASFRGRLRKGSSGTLWLRRLRTNCSKAHLTCCGDFSSLRRQQPGSHGQLRACWPTPDALLAMDLVHIHVATPTTGTLRGPRLLNNHLRLGVVSHGRRGLRAHSGAEGGSWEAVLGKRLRAYAVGNGGRARCRNITALPAAQEHVQSAPGRLHLRRVELLAG